VLALGTETALCILAQLLKVCMLRQERSSQARLVIPLLTWHWFQGRRIRYWLVVPCIESLNQPPLLFKHYSVVSNPPPINERPYYQKEGVVTRDS
jgi:hypothetical protein